MKYWHYQIICYINKFKLHVLLTNLTANLCWSPWYTYISTVTQLCNNLRLQDNKDNTDTNKQNHQHKLFSNSFFLSAFKSLAALLSHSSLPRLFAENSHLSCNSHSYMPVITPIVDAIEAKADSPELTSIPTCILFQIFAIQMIYFTILRFYMEILNVAKPLSGIMFNK